ncbi:MAG TPA: Gfo/Idh/MocA family oxidoreductase, partial [Fimbriimonas sp.]|nr:Gfo/Idh/MocA family oxidoreductase [Fimbriimonas sp.]
MNVGIIGGGLMGRETASALARWVAIAEPGLTTPKLVAVCDSNPQVLEWYRGVPSVSQLTSKYHELLANPDVDVVYAAVPHHL